jgi:hypothetical protein
MNLRDLSQAIKDNKGDDELVAYYTKKRAELLAILNRDIVKHATQSKRVRK